MHIKKRIAFIGIILSMVAGIVAGVDMIGETASTANVLIVFFSGMTGGASLTSYIRNKKKKE